MANNHTTQQNGFQLCKKEESLHLQVAVVMVPLPAQGHLNQLLHLSRRISAYKIPIYYVGTTTHIRQAKLRHPSSITNVHFHEFPTPPFHNPPPDPNSSEKFPSQIVPALKASTHLRQHVYTFINELSRIFRRVVVIYDSLMSYVVQDIDSKQKNVDCYRFRSISAFTVCSWEAADWNDELSLILKEAPSMDGYYPDEFSEFLNLQSRSRDVFSGEIYNSNREIEGLYLDLLAKRNKKNGGEKNIWVIGPFNPISVLEKNIDSKNRHKCLQFLDKQESNSVIFVSFGTTSSFSDEQIKEIALGLERSEKKFIWVLRDADKGDIFSGEVRKTELPEGFEERVRERGILVRDWAPQLEILGHTSTGGFMSHCGWNSCLESISMGVPIAAWPMHSDQPGNAVLITKVLKIGLIVKNWSRSYELVLSERVENVVGILMGSSEGDEMRKRAAELGGAVKKSVEGGATHDEMESFIANIIR